MAQTFGDRNQRTIPTDNLGRNHPMHPVTQNSELKGKAKADASRLHDRQEREHLLRQHRLMQQKNVKLQHEREKAHKIPVISEHKNPNQHFQENKHAEASPKAHVVAHGPFHRQHESGYAAKAHGQPSTSPADPNHRAVTDHDGRSALGDRSSRMARCTNCCGRPQVPGPQETQHSLYQCSERVESSEDHGFGSQFACTNRRGVVTRIGCADRCALEPRVHGRVTDAAEELEAESPSATSNDDDEMRLRGGCGGGGGCGGAARNSIRCPCGGCGGAACGTCNTCCETKPPQGCCSGNQTRGLPCRCRCSSCSNPCPSAACGTCGGQNCGKWNSCAGSGGGKCCFPRNTRRRNGPDCCGGGGGSGGCGGCC